MTKVNDTWFGHPKALFMLFSAEMWERFSYYGMRALLVLFLTASTLEQGFGWNSMEALSLYGTYTGLVYLTPLIGGWLADNFIGARKSIVIGGLLMAVGHFLMAGPALVPAYYTDKVGYDVEEILIQSKVPMGESLNTEIIIHDKDLNKSTKTTIKDAIHNTVNMSVVSSTNPNKGLSPVDKVELISALESTYKGIGFIFYLALAFIIVGNGFFKPNISTTVGKLYEDGDNRRDSGFTIFYMGINIGAFFGSLICGYFGESPDWGWHYGFSIAGVGMLIGLTIFMIYQNKLLGDIGKKPTEKFSFKNKDREPLTKIEFDRIKTLLIMVVFTVIFWAGFEQAGGAMNIYTKENTDRMLFGFEIPASWFQSLNAFFIILFAPVFASFWIGMKDKSPSSHRIYSDRK